MIAAALEFLMWIVGFLFPKKSDAEKLGIQESENVAAEKYIKKEADVRAAVGMVRDDPSSVYNDPDNRSR